MVVFRFENEDIMAWKENGTIKHRLGSVGTNNIEGTLFNTVRAGIVREACLFWLRDAQCAVNVGATGVAALCLTMISHPS